MNSNPKKRLRINELKSWHVFENYTNEMTEETIV